MQSDLNALEQRLQSVVFGQELVVRQLMVGLLAGGHVLLQGVPGIGKTKLARSLTRLVGGSYHRIQFTPDLLPSDILGNAVFHMGKESFDIHQGPVFSNVVLADEINRTPPKTQAALLEAMEERQVTIYGETLSLPKPFFVIGTQNPIEYEGTYPLPEAQLDRFLLQVLVEYPRYESEIELLTHHRADASIDDLEPVLDPVRLLAAMQAVRDIPVSQEVVHYIVDLVRASRQASGVSLGASPRAAIALMECAKAVAFLEDRAYVIPDDVIEVVKPVLRHRLVLNPNAELEGVRPDDVVDRIVESVEVPR